MAQTLEQRRAAFALAKVKTVAANADKFKPLLVKLPARLHTNGLGQTVAFYLSNGQPKPDGPVKPEFDVYSWLGEWLKGPGNPYHGVPGSLIDAITTQDAIKYRAASTEARALANWLKRLAEAFLEGRNHA